MSNISATLEMIDQIIDDREKQRLEELTRQKIKLNKMCIDIIDYIRSVNLLVKPDIILTLTKNIVVEVDKYTAHFNHLCIDDLRKYETYIILMHKITTIILDMNLIIDDFTQPTKLSIIEDCIKIIEDKNSYRDILLEICMSIGELSHSDISRLKIILS